LPNLISTTIIGSTFAERTDSVELIIGPAGLALSTHDQTLYIADSLKTRIAAIQKSRNTLTVDIILPSHFDRGTVSELAARVLIIR
jgi:sugar lactone lactonase YvrE